MSDSTKKIMVCGGGTGGHFFSGVAVAEIFLEKYPNGRALFVGSRYGIEARYPLNDSRMSKAFVLARGVKGRSIFQKLSALALLAVGCLQSVAILIRFRPHFVIGVGGYASVPGVFAATFLRWLFRWKVIVLDQNSSPGVANRVFSKMPVLAYCAFKYPGFQMVDLPLRKKFSDAARMKREFVWPPKTIFVLGGSQGARGLNEAWKKLIPSLKEANPNIKIIHQTGAKDEHEWADFYRKANLTAQVFAFSDEIQKYYDQADVLVSRSGAMTVFEVMAYARPAVFVPFPAAADDHQTKNARSVQSSDWVVAEKDLNWPQLSRLLQAQSPEIPHRQNDEIVSWDKILA